MIEFAVFIMSSSEYCKIKKIQKKNNLVRQKNVWVLKIPAF
jgi:hypothetical protein